MSANLRYPNITGGTQTEQLAQIKSFLHQLIEQLNYSLQSPDSGEQNASSTQVQGAELSYYDMRSLIIQEMAEINTLFDQLSSKMQSEYVKSEDLPFTSVDEYTLKVEGKVLKVNTTDDAEEDNTRPITSSGVHVIVGNIDTLLSQI